MEVMPTPKHMIWIVALAAGTFVALRRYEGAKGAVPGAGTPKRYGA